MEGGAEDTAERFGCETKTWCGTESLKQVLVHCTIYILLYID